MGFSKEKYKAKKVKMKRSSAGIGLFADELIKRNDFIIEYVGDTISLNEANKRGGKYLFEVSPRRFVDGKSRKNIARYINHSCRPNCEVDIVRGRVLVYARCSIKVGDELHYDYGKEYFDDHIKPFGCKCSHCVVKKEA